MDYIVESIMFGFIGFINLVLAIAFDLVRSNLWEQIRSASNNTGVYAQVNPHLITLESIFWIIFIISMVGCILAYVLGAHKEEFEQYDQPRYPGGF